MKVFSGFVTGIAAGVAVTLAALLAFLSWYTSDAPAAQRLRDWSER